MQGALRVKTTVQPGHRVEFTAPDLPEGADIELSVRLSDTPEETSRARFEALASRWQEETGALSSITQKAMHPAYQEIIGLGSDALPLILHELELEPGHWFWALRAITGENPVVPEQQGRMREMAAAWLEWGRDRGYVS